MAQENRMTFDTTLLLNEIQEVIENGLNKILCKHMNRYQLLEETHSKIMLLPSVLDELNKNNFHKKFDYDYKFKDNYEREENLSYKCGSNLDNEISSLKNRLADMEKTQVTFTDFLDKLFVKFCEVNDQIKNIKEIPQPSKPNDKENINLHIEDINEEQTDCEKKEEEYNVEVVEKEKEEVVEEEQEEIVEEEEQVVEEVVEEEEEVEEAEKVEEEKVVEDEEEVVEEENSIETETKEEPVEQEEDDEDIFEIEIDDKTYCTNNDQNGFIWELTEDGEQGEKVGYFVDEEPFFYADE